MALSRTFRAAMPTALPLVTSARLAKVPAPQLNLLVSPVTTVTSPGSQPSASAAIWANVVWWPWPWLVRPVAPKTLPLGATRPVVRRHHRRVRVRDLELDRVIRKPVRAGELGRGDDRHDDAVRRVGAGVVDEPVAEPEDPALAVDRRLDVVELAALLAGGDQMLAPV